MDSMFENEPFDLSSISYLNHQAKRLEDFSLLESPNPKQSSSVKEDRVGHEKTKHKGRCYSNDHSPERPLSQGVMVREQEGMISELKKECFGLKLRIYYMEEQLRETFDANVEDILKENVELKVAVEELKNEVVFKTDLLTKASQAMQQMSGENDYHLKKKTGENVNKIEIDYECRLKEKDEHIKVIEQELLHLSVRLAEWEKSKEGKGDKQHLSVLHEKDEKYNQLVAKKQQDEDSLKAVICELEQTLDTKEKNIEILRNDLRRLASNTPPDHGNDQQYKSVCERLEMNLAEKESTLLQVRSELTCKTNLVESYKGHISKLEQSLKETRDICEEKELEMQQSIRQLQDQYKKLCSNIQMKEEELQVKDKALTEAKEEKLLACQQKVQFELDSIKTKESHIIGLEIKIKQQKIDLNKSIEEHSRILKEKEETFVELESKYSTVQHEMTRLKVEVDEYKSLTGDLKNSLEKNTEREKTLQQQLKEKDIQIEEIKRSKELAACEMSHKHQELLSRVKEKELIIMEYKEALCIAKKLNHVPSGQDQSRKTQGEGTLLNDMREEVYQNALKEKDKVIHSLNKAVEGKEKEMIHMASVKCDLTEKNQIIDSLTNEIKELKVSLPHIESGDLLEAECKAVDITKISIEEQLQISYSQLLNKDSNLSAREKELIGELEKISNIFHSVVETYKLLLEKLSNNQHPDIQVRILLHEKDSVEHTQGNFRTLFHAVLNKLQVGGNFMGEITDSKVSNSFNGSNDEYTIEKQTRNDITGTIKELYEQTLDEKKEEISILTRKINQEKQVSELLLQQKDILSQQLDSKQKHYIQEISTFKATIAKLEVQISENAMVVETKEERIFGMQEEICNMQSENKDLNSKIENLHAQLEHSNGELSKTNLELKTAETNVMSLKSQLSMGVEAISDQRNILQKDVKELYEMNMRLKKKIKAYELVVKKKDIEKGKLKEELEESVNKNKELEGLLSNTSSENKTMEAELLNMRNKVKEYESIDEKHNSIMSSNIELSEKVAELTKLNKLHENATLQEIKKLGESVEALNQQRSTSKGDLEKTQMEVDKKTSEISKLQNELDKQSKEINEYMNDKMRLEHDLQTQSNIVNIQVIKITDLEAAVQTQLDTFNEKASECVRLQDELQKQSKKNEEKDKDIASLQSILQKQLMEIDEKVSDNTKLQTAINEVNIENKRLEEEIQQLCESSENNELVDKLTSELMESKSLINSLQSQVSVCGDAKGEITRLKDDIKRLKHAKMQLRAANRKLTESADEMSQKLSTSAEENNIKLQEIEILKTQMHYLEEKIENFSPLYTSSAHNLPISSSDISTQTESNEHVKYENRDENSLITEHINEMKQLRRQLEETISNNDSLRNRLQERLKEVEQDASLLHDPHFRITLIRDNDSMRTRLQEADINEGKLKLQVKKLKEEKEKDTEIINTLNAQTQELNVLSTNLKLEMEVYDRLIQQLGMNRKKQLSYDDLGKLNSQYDLDKNLLLAFLEEIRDLRDKLQLTIDVNNQLREKLEKEFGYSVQETLETPMVSQVVPRSLFSGPLLWSLNANMSAEPSVAQNTQSLADYTSLDETPTKDIGVNDTPVGLSRCVQRSMKVYDESESFVIFGKLSDFKLVKETVVVLLEKLSSCFKKLKSQKENNMNTVRDIAQIRKLVKEISVLLSGLIISDIQQNVTNLVAEKCNTSGFDIASQLVKACDTLKTTKGNLQLRNSMPPSRNASPNN